MGGAEMSLSIHDRCCFSRSTWNHVISSTEKHASFFSRIHHGPQSLTWRVIHECKRITKMRLPMSSRMSHHTVLGEGSTCPASPDHSCVTLWLTKKNGVRHRWSGPICIELWSLLTARTSATIISCYVGICWCTQSKWWVGSWKGFLFQHVLHMHYIHSLFR
jgi:hypothetical protein